MPGKGRPVTIRTLLLGGLDRCHEVRSMRLGDWHRAGYLKSVIPSCYMECAYDPDPLGQKCIGSPETYGFPVQAGVCVPGAVQST